jgi:hypothetical protein
LELKEHPLNIKNDELVKSQKIHLLSFSDESKSLTGENRNPVISIDFWTPAFAGVTELGLFTILSKIRCSTLIAFKTIPYGINRTCECLENKLVLMGVRPALGGL